MLLGALGVAALLIIGRAVQLQALEGDKWSRIAKEQHRARVLLPARRGGIFDRDGVPLALSRETYGIAVAPRELRDPRAAADALVETLEISHTEAQRATDRESAWVVLRVRATPEQYSELAGIRGLHFERRLERFYPQAGIGRELIGIVSGDGRALGGIEQQFDDVLRGTSGYSVMWRDARGNAQPAISLPVVPPTDGADIYLTIDFTLQEIADGALRDAIRETGAAGGDLLILDPRTGEVLAAVSRRNGAARSLSLITEPYEPGSTLKPFFVAGLLAGGHASLSDSVFAENGAWRDPNGRTFRDVHPYGWLTVRDALRVSSNISMAKLSSRLDAGEQYRSLRDFGFGTSTGIAFPAESGGRLRPPSDWSALSPGSLAMGYEISVTPLQLILAYGALANGGTLMEPRLLREAQAPNGEMLYRMRPRVVRRVVPAGTAEAITNVLVSVVEDGTATRASLATFAVAGKTGTARRTGAGGSYQAGSYTSTFAGYFPAKDPQIAILVKLDRPQGAYYGGLTAAPVTRETLQALLAARAPALDRRSLLAGSSSRDRHNRRPATERRGRSGTGPEEPFVILLDGDNFDRSAPDPTLPVPVPTVGGLPLRDAVRRLHTRGFHVRLRGSGIAERTEPAAGALLPAGDTLVVIGSAHR